MQWVYAGSKAFPIVSTGIISHPLSVLYLRASWEFLFSFILVIYTTSAILLMLMARCLNRLPVIQETLLRARAEALESMMFYVFIYIIYGLCLCVLYGLNVMINHHFQSWEPRFVSSFVLELVSVSLLSPRRFSTYSSRRAAFSRASSSWTISGTAGGSSTTGTRWETRAMSGTARCSRCSTT